MKRMQEPHCGTVE